MSVIDSEQIRRYRAGSIALAIFLLIIAGLSLRLDRWPFTDLALALMFLGIAVKPAVYLPPYPRGKSFFAEMTALQKGLHICACATLIVPIVVNYFKIMADIV